MSQSLPRTDYCQAHICGDLIEDDGLCAICRLSPRICYFCDVPIQDGASAVQSKTGNAWAHYSCWYEHVAFGENHHAYA